ncbi:MFS transporter [Streptosporangium sp. KLBMP 9127]|nr:MFS transporter [Streptosporangium sp. KLBMP 9127]
MGSHVLTARSAGRRYALISFLNWLPSGLMMAPMVLLMAERGIGIAEIGVITAVYSAVCIALELPTGGLADVLSRRVVLAASAAFGLVGLAVMAFSVAPWQFLVASVLKGVSRALSSGPAQAWYVDTLHAVAGPDADLKPGLARGGAAGSISLCVSMLAGGFVPLVVPEGPITPLAVPVLAGAAASGLLLVAALVAMPEPARPRTTLGAVLRDVPVTIRAGLRLGLRDRGLSRLLLVALTVGVVLGAIELLTPGRLAELTGRPETGGTAYAVVAALGFGAHALGSSLVPALARLAGSSVRAAIAATVVTALAAGALAASTALDGPPGVVAAAVAYVALFAALSVLTLLRTEMMHHRVPSAQRATLMSVDSLQLQFGGMVASVAGGLLAAGAGTGLVWGIAAVILLAGALLFVRLPAPAVVSSTPVNAPG